MPVELNAEEQKLRSDIEARVAKASEAFEESRLDEELNRTIFEAGKTAHALHMLLKKRGLEPKHHRYMVQNRGMPADAPEFYMHFHPLEDLLKFLADPHANDDAFDQTIGADFTFAVYSRRWGHDDTYRIRRTKDGWTIAHMAINGPCDKGGRPFLFENLRQDSIQFPVDLAGWFEWLWSQAESKGLAKEEVQKGLNQLSEWVKITEQKAPSGGLWEGY